MALISCLLVFSTLAPTTRALDTSVVEHAPYIQEESRFCSDGPLCYSSLIQHSAASFRLSAKSAAVAPLASQQLQEPRDPVVYVYELPEHLTDNNIDIVFRDLDCPWASSEEGDVPSDHCLFGDGVDVSLPGGSKDKLKAYDIDNFALGRIFFASLLRHPRRTFDPQKADLFFIPAFTGAHPNETHCPTAAQLVQQLPYLNRQTAGRHFWMTPTTGWAPRTCAVFNSRLGSTSPAEQLLAKTMKLALEDRTSAPTRLLLDDLGGTNWEPGRHPPVAENLHSVPYASVISGLDDADVEAWMTYATAHEQREYLVSAVWGVHGMASTIGMRMTLTRQCEASPKCLFFDLGLFGPHESHTDEVLPVLLNSTFCLGPTGDTPSRKGIVDSIVAGCIPVLFSPLQEQLWPWHVDRWEDVAILVEDTSQDVIGLLAQIPEAEVRRLQGNMAQLAPRLTFSPPGHPRPGDALETALAGIWRAST